MGAEHQSPVGWIRIIGVLPAVTLSVIAGSRSKFVTRRHILLVALTIASVSCAGRAEFVQPVELTNHRWQEVYQDEEFRVSLDLAHIEEGLEPDTFAVWYQTQRFVMQEEDGEPWNREVIRSLLRCTPLEFKTVRVTVFLDDGPPVAQVGATLEDISDQPWRAVIPESIDAASMKGACALITANRNGKE